MEEYFKCKLCVAKFRVAGLDQDDLILHIVSHFFEVVEE